MLSSDEAKVWGRHLARVNLNIPFDLSKVKCYLLIGLKFDDVIPSEF